MPIFKVVLITDSSSAANPKDYLPNSIPRAYLPNYCNSIGKNYFSRYQGWQKIIKEYSIDIVISGLWNEECTFWDILSVKGSCLKPGFILLQDNYSCYTFQQESVSGLKVYSNYLLCDTVITRSKCDELFASTFNSNVSLIYNLLSTRLRNTGPSRHCQNQLLWIGKLDNEKNLSEVIKAVYIIAQKIPTIKLIIVGEQNSKIKGESLNLISNLKLEKNIIIEYSHEEVYKYLKNTSVLISTSIQNDYIMSFLTAMSYSIPIVSYNIPWSDYIFGNKGIISVPQGEYKELANTVIKLVTNFNEINKRGTEGRKYLENMYSIDVVSQWKNLLLNLPKRSNPKENNFNINLINILRYNEEGLKKQKRDINNHYKNILSRKISEIDLKRNEIEKIKKSKAYRLGNFLMSIPQNVRKIF